MGGAGVALYFQNGNLWNGCFRFEIFAKLPCFVLKYTDINFLILLAFFPVAVAMVKRARRGYSLFVKLVDTPWLPQLEILMQKLLMAILGRNKRMPLLSTPWPIPPFFYIGGSSSFDYATSFIFWSSVIGFLLCKKLWHEQIITSTGKYLTNLQQKYFLGNLDFFPNPNWNPNLDSLEDIWIFG